MDDFVIQSRIRNMLNEQLGRGGCGTNYGGRIMSYKQFMHKHLGPMGMKAAVAKWKKYKKMHGIRTGAAMVGGRRRRAPKRRRRIRRGRGVEEDSSLDSCARLAAKKWHIPIEQARKIIEEYALYNHITYKCEFDNSLSKYGPYASRADVVRSELAQDLDYAGLKDRVAKRKKLARQIEREYGITGEYPATQNDARVFYQKGINKNTDSLARLKELISASEYPGDIY